MEVRAGYKQSDVGVIPAEWDSRELGDLFSLKGGFAFSSEFFSDNGPIVLTPGNFKLQGGLYFEERNTKRYSGSYNSSMTFKRGDLLIVMTDLTPDCNLLGKPAFVTTDDVILHNQRIGRVVFKGQSIEENYLFYVLLSRNYLDRIKGAATGSTVRHTSNKSIYIVPIPLPPLPEQRAIAGALGHVDALLGALTRLIAKKRDLKRAAMQQLLTGQTRLPGFSGEWEVRRLGEIALPRVERIDPQRAGIHDFCVELEHIGQASGQLRGSTATSEHSSLKSVFRAGDVLFGKLRAYLRKYWFADRDGVCSTEIWPLVAQRQMVVPAFLFQMVQTDDFIEVASTAYGTHMPRSDWNVVKHYEVVVPSVNEQTAIATVLSDMDAELAALESRLAKTRALKQGMMQELLTGRTRLV